MTTRPISPASLPTAQAPVRPAPTAPAAGPEARPAGPADARVAKPVQAVGEARDVDLDAIAVPEEEGDTTAIEAAMEVNRLARMDGSVGVGKIGAIIKIAQEAKGLAQMLASRPLQVDRLLGALAGIAVGLSEFDELTKALGVVGGVGNAIMGVKYSMEALERLKAEGANPSTILEGIASVTQAIGGACQAAAVVALGVFPPAAPILEGISVACYLASGAAYLGQLAYDNRAWIADKATKAWEAVSGGFRSLFGGGPAPGRAGP